MKRMRSGLLAVLVLVAAGFVRVPPAVVVLFVALVGLTLACPLLLGAASLRTPFVRERSVSAFQRARDDWPNI